MQVESTIERLAILFFTESCRNLLEAGRKRKSDYNMKIQEANTMTS